MSEGTVTPEVRMAVADISIANTCTTVEAVVRKMGWWPWETGSAMSVVKRRKRKGGREGGREEERKRGRKRGREEERKRGREEERKGGREERGVKGRTER